MVSKWKPTPGPTRAPAPGRGRTGRSLVGESGGFELNRGRFSAPRELDMVVDAYASLAAGIAIAGGLIGTGMAQSGIGAAGMGIIAEKPEKFGQVLFFFVIPETLWIIGFVLGIILLLGIIHP
jgi:V/A-type H+/Na+-transporting ATPase subunit K